MNLNLDKFDGAKVATVLSMMVSRDSNLPLFVDEDNKSIGEFMKTMSFSEVYRVDGKRVLVMTTEGVD